MSIAAREQGDAHADLDPAPRPADTTPGAEPRAEHGRDDHRDQRSDSTGTSRV